MATAGVRKRVGENSATAQSALSVKLPPGAEFVVLSPNQEAAYEFRAVQDFAQHGNVPWAVIGMGGGSTQISLSDGKGTILFPYGYLSSVESGDCDAASPAWPDLTAACSAKHWEAISAVCWAAVNMGLNASCEAGSSPSKQYVLQVAKTTFDSGAVHTDSENECRAKAQQTLVDAFLKKLSADCSSFPGWESTTIEFRHVGFHEGKEVAASPAVGFFLHLADEKSS
jgi:hypothetical protein